MNSIQETITNYILKTIVVLTILFEGLKILNRFYCLNIYYCTTQALEYLKVVIKYAISDIKEVTTDSLLVSIFLV